LRKVNQNRANICHTTSWERSKQRLLMIC